MIDLAGQNVVVIVFAMGECPACEHYLPRLISEIEQLKTHGYPFVIGGSQQHIRQGSIPVFIYDAASPDADVQKLADRYDVQATPTTILLTRGAGSFKCEGNLANNQIIWILNMANEANQ